MNCCRTKDDIRAAEQLAANIQRPIPYEPTGASARQSPTAIACRSRDRLLGATGERVYRAYD